MYTHKAPSRFLCLRKVRMAFQMTHFLGASYINPGGCMLYIDHLFAAGMRLKVEDSTAHDSA